MSSSNAEGRAKVQFVGRTGHPCQMRLCHKQPNTEQPCGLGRCQWNATSRSPGESLVCEQEGHCLRAGSSSNCTRCTGHTGGNMPRTCPDGLVIRGQQARDKRRRVCASCLQRRPDRGRQFELHGGLRHGHPHPRPVLRTPLQGLREWHAGSAVRKARPAFFARTCTNGGVSGTTHGTGALDSAGLWEGARCVAAAHTNGAQLNVGNARCRSLRILSGATTTVGACKVQRRVTTQTGLV